MLKIKHNLALITILINTFPMLEYVSIETGCTENLLMLEVFKSRLDKAVGNLVYWKLSLPRARAWS